MSSMTSRHRTQTSSSQVTWGTRLASDGAQGALDEDRLTHVLGDCARRHRVPGAQLAIQYGGRQVRIEHGVLRHGGEDRVTERDAFPVGSITKSFTALLIMMLAADGDCELDSPLGDTVPELSAGAAIADSGARLTLRQLLSHTSGLASDPESDEVAELSLRRYVREQCARPELVLRPGTGFSYSNVGYALAGHVVETITGMSWWHAVQSIVLAELDIEPAFIPIPGGPHTSRTIATGHAVNTTLDHVIPVDQCLAWSEVPAGGLALSAADLVAFGRAMFAEGVPGAVSLLPEDYAQEMRTPVPAATAFGLADEWCTGLALFRDGEEEWVGHDGNADGTSCHLRIDPANGTVVALTTNSGTGVHLWRDLLTELRGMGISVGDHLVALPTTPQPVPPGCLGSYVNGEVEYTLLPIGDDSVGLAVDGDVLAELTVFDGYVFDLRDVTSGKRLHAGRFLPDPDTGELDRIQVLGRLARRRRTESARC